MGLLSPLELIRVLYCIAVILEMQRLTRGSDVATEFEEEVHHEAQQQIAGGNLEPWFKAYRDQRKAQSASVKV